VADFLQDFLVAVQRVRWPRGFEGIEECELFFGCHEHYSLLRAGRGNHDSARDNSSRFLKGRIVESNPAHIFKTKFFDAP